MNKLRELRESHKLPQKALATLLGKTVQAYSLYELDKRNIDNEALKTLSQFYKVSIDYLLDNNLQTPVKGLIVNEDEIAHIKKYRQLDANGIIAVDNYMEFLLAQAADNAKKNRAAFRLMRCKL